MKKFFNIIIGFILLIIALVLIFILTVNILTDNLTDIGEILVWILTEKHCIDAIK